MHLTNVLVELSFNRLSSSKKEGKTPLERTSALMYFLAFDASVKRLEKNPLDFNPKGTEGKNNRSFMEFEFVRLVLLRGSQNGAEIKQVLALGQIDSGGISPEKRISSNFFTVPLKKASQSAIVYQYPNRPAPVLKMGKAATDLIWGIDYFDDWKKNLPKLLSEVRSNTPFTDLAIFACRQSLFGTGDIRSELSQAIVAKFSPNLAAFWIKQIEGERMFFKHGSTPFQTEPPNAFATRQDMKNVSINVGILQDMDKQTLVNRIIYLEGLLDTHDIKYQVTS